MTSDGERITDLESTVEELEATVRGLTEELVEANERIRQLENAVEPDDDKKTARSQRRVEEAKSTESNGEKQTTYHSESNSDSGSDSSSDSDSDSGDDIIVA